MDLLSCSGKNLDTICLNFFVNWNYYDSKFRKEKVAHCNFVLADALSLIVGKMTKTKQNKEKNNKDKSTYPIQVITNAKISCNYY